MSGMPTDDRHSTAVSADSSSDVEFSASKNASDGHDAQNAGTRQRQATNETGARANTGLSEDASATIRKLRRSAHHIKAIPESSSVREQIKEAAETYLASLGQLDGFTRSHLERWSLDLLQRLELPEAFLGFVAVMLGNAFWRRQFLAIPFERRLLLLPHCLRHSETCTADYDAQGLDCEACGACSIAAFKTRAEQLGYKVLVAEGSPIVLRIIVGGHVDGILGVACLNVLEKALDKVLFAGVPSYAVPLCSSNCKDTSLDEPWLWEVLDKYEPLSDSPAIGYVPLMRLANDLFEKDFERLLPRVRSRSSEDQEPTPLVARTEEIAYDWLARGGKRFRPFITLAAYSSLGGSRRNIEDRPGHEAVRGFPDAVCRVAMAIEAFHKASLVHDDIEDNDLYRYGRETLHRRYDIGTAINVGDYLIGLGYQLVNSAGRELGPAAACDILDRMAAAHIKLCDGQGAEMAWQASPELDITPLDALQIYALKTSPAFEAALYAGLRMAGSVEDYEETVTAFSRHIGVGFQILNDLKDWQGDDDNKLVAGQDAAALRPTVLLALALESSDEAKRREMVERLGGNDPIADRIDYLRRLFLESGTFDKAQALVAKSRARAEALADAVEPEEFRQLLRFLTDTVLSPDVCPSKG